jgi:hypothetical protein
MIRKLPGLHASTIELAHDLNGFFLAQVEYAAYRWHAQKPFLAVRFGILEPEASLNRSFSGRIYCSERALWRLSWFLRDFGYDAELLGRDQVDEKASLHLRGVVRTSATRFRGGFYQSLDGFAPASEWETVSHAPNPGADAEGNSDDLQL